MRRLCVCLVAGTVIAAGAWFARPPAVAQPPAAGGGAGFEPRGAGSCAAAGCHNANGPKGAKGSEYTTWVLHDPHARAFDVLSDERSLRIQRNRPDVRDEDRAYPERDALCVECHVAPAADPRRHRLTISDGVSCEACHGAAGGWLTQHYTAAWKEKTPAQKEAAGMADTKDLLTRAELCARCHVGEGGMEVNHDLIAAGHPRLGFEYAAYHGQMPKHWDVAREKEKYPDFDARLWLIGQVVSARASLRLLGARASDGKGPWPEFAESDCFACHHDLADQARRRGRRPAGGRPGAPGWGTWYFALDDVVKQHPPRGGLAYPEAAVGKLRELMTAPAPDRKAVRQSARAAADALEKWLPALRAKTAGWPPQELARALELKLWNDLDKSGWDEMTQLYLALRAQRPAKPDLLERYRKGLDFPSGFDSRPGFDPAELRKGLRER